MDEKDLRRGATWMTGTELRRYRRFVRALEEHCATHGVAWTPLLGVRLRDVVVCHLLLLRVEAMLLPEDGLEADPKATTPTAVAEAIGKAQERGRKAMRELEDYCVKAGAPIDQGIADMMRPIIRQMGSPEAASEATSEADNDSVAA